MTIFREFSIDDGKDAPWHVCLLTEMQWFTKVFTPSKLSALSQLKLITIARDSNVGEGEARKIACKSIYKPKSKGVWPS